MTAPSQSHLAWDAINADKRLDRIIRRVGVVAWVITALLLIAYGTMISIEAIRMARLVALGAMGKEVPLDVLSRFAAVLGGLSLLVAVLCTIGVFLRMRTATLAEIQLRLAALEDMLAKRGDEG